MGYYIALLGLLLSQIFPTFGDSLGSAGNGLPYYVSIATFSVAYMVYLTDGMKRNTFLIFTLFYVAAIMYVILITLTSPLPLILRDMSSLIKFISMYLSLACGYLSYRHSGSFKGFFMVAGMACGLNIILLIAHWIEPFSFMQRLYFYREVGHGRFPGTWNHPYNLSIFFFAVTIFGVYKFLKPQTREDRLFYFLFILFSIYVCLFATQARSAFAAFWVSAFYGSMIFIIHSFVKNSGKQMIGSVFTVLIIAVMAFVAYMFLQYALSAGEYSHLTKLVDPTTGLPDSRLQQIQVLMNEYWEEYPIRAIFGFGAGRGDEFNLESSMNYIFQYGFIGGPIFVMGIWFLLFFKTLKIGFITPDTTISHALLLANVVLMYIFLMGVSTNILLHFRFIPLGYFAAGMMLAYFERLRNEEQAFIKHSKALKMTRAQYAG